MTAAQWFAECVRTDVEKACDALLQSDNAFPNILKSRENTYKFDSSRGDPQCSTCTTCMKHYKHDGECGAPTRSIAERLSRGDTVDIRFHVIHNDELTTTTIGVSAYTRWYIIENKLYKKTNTDETKTDYVFWKTPYQTDRDRIYKTDRDRIYICGTLLTNPPTCISVEDDGKITFHVYARAGANSNVIIGKVQTLPFSLKSNKIDHIYRSGCGLDTRIRVGASVTKSTPSALDDDSFNDNFGNNFGNGDVITVKVNRPAKPSQEEFFREQKCILDLRPQHLKLFENIDITNKPLIAFLESHPYPTPQDVCRFAEKHETHQSADMHRYLQQITSVDYAGTTHASLAESGPGKKTKKAKRGGIFTRRANQKKKQDNFRFIYVEADKTHQIDTFLCVKYKREMFGTHIQIPFIITMTSIEQLQPETDYCSPQKVTVEATHSTYMCIGKTVKDDAPDASRDIPIEVTENFQREDVVTVDFKRDVSVVENLKAWFEAVCGANINYFKIYRNKNIEFMHKRTFLTKKYTFHLMPAAAAAPEAAAAAPSTNVAVPMTPPSVSASEEAASAVNATGVTGAAAAGERATAAAEAAEAAAGTGTAEAAAAVAIANKAYAAQMKPTKNEHGEVCKNFFTLFKSYISEHINEENLVSCLHEATRSLNTAMVQACLEKMSTPLIDTNLAATPLPKTGTALTLPIGLDMTKMVRTEPNRAVSAAATSASQETVRCFQYLLTATQGITLGRNYNDIYIPAFFLNVNNLMTFICSFQISKVTYGGFLSVTIDERLTANTLASYLMSIIHVITILYKGDGADDDTNLQPFLKKFLEWACTRDGFDKLKLSINSTIFLKAGARGAYNIDEAQEKIKLILEEFKFTEGDFVFQKPPACDELKDLIYKIMLSQFAAGGNTFTKSILDNIQELQKNDWDNVFKKHLKWIAMNRTVNKKAKGTALTIACQCEASNAGERESLTNIITRIAAKSTKTNTVELITGEPKTALQHYQGAHVGTTDANIVFHLSLA